MPANEGAECGSGRGLGGREVRERADRALGEVWVAEIEPRLWLRWDRGGTEIAISAMVDLVYSG